MQTPRTITTICLLAAAAYLTWGATAGAGDLGACLVGELDLGGARTFESRYFLMETELTAFEEDGSRTPGGTFTLWLEARPSGKAGSVSYVCRKFSVTRPGGRETELPTLGNWAYTFSAEDSGVDAKGQVFGIPHEKFALLVDSRGDILDSSTGYMVYNAFIDFHGLNDVFATGMTGGGVQDLRRIGDTVVHAAANTSAPVGLGGAVKKRSVFRNGEVTLELKGLSTVDGLPCALLGYDSGESSYLMYLAPMPGMDTKAEGASHYFGDLYLELDTGWLRKGTLHEFVVSRVTSGRGEPIRSVIERAIRLEAMEKKEFEQRMRAARR